MKTRMNVTLMTPDPSVGTAVTSALQSNGHVVSGATLKDVRELLALLPRGAAPIILVDLDPQPKEVLRHLERLIPRFPNSRFVALSSSLQNELLLEAMQTGLRRVVVKQSMAAELSGVLDRLTASETVEECSEGDVLTVLSASGGCGATTIAVNLAEELSLQNKQPTLLCDLDLCYGGAACYLGLNSHYSIDHVLNHSENVDAQLIRSTATIHNDRLHILASPASVNFADPASPRFEGLEQALDAARKAYHSTVVDAPRVPIAVAASLVAASTHTLLVFQLTVKDLRVARALLDALGARGLAGSVIPLANRYAKRQMIGLDEAKKALGSAEIPFVRNDYSPAIQGLNFGQPLSEAGPRSALRKDLQQLLSRLRQNKLAS